jgi:hypothetical protein
MASPRVGFDIALAIAAKRSPRVRQIEIREGQVEYWLLQR